MLAPSQIVLKNFEQNMDMFLNHPSSSSMASSSSSSSIQDHILEVTVVSGHGLKGTDWLTKPNHVVVQYGSTQFRTRSCKDGGTNPVFPHDKFQFKLIEGLHKLMITVHSGNSVATNNVIGKGKVYLQVVFSSGYLECSCLLVANDKKSAGEIKLILRYPNSHGMITILQAVLNNVAEPYARTR